MAKIISITGFEAVRDNDGNGNKPKRYYVIFKIAGDPDVKINKVTIEEFDIKDPADTSTVPTILEKIENDSTFNQGATVIADSDDKTVTILDDVLGYEFQCEAYKNSPGKGEHHKFLKITITLSDNDKLIHSIVTKRGSTYPGTESDVMRPLKP